MSGLPTLNPGARSVDGFAVDPSEAETRPPGEAPSRPAERFERRLAPGEVVFEIGDAGASLFVVHEGCIELLKRRPEGTERYAELGPGEFFGEMAVLIGRPHSMRAVARTQARVLEIDRETFEAMCVERPEIAIRVIRRLAGRVAELEARLGAGEDDEILRPFVRAVLRLAKPDRSEAIVPGRLRDLAEIAELPLWDAHRALAHLFERRCARLEEDVLYVPDLDRLAAVLDP